MNGRTRIAFIIAALLLTAGAVFAQAAVEAAPAFRAGTTAGPAGAGPAPAAQSSMGIPAAVILGAVEGITEYLPVSSTGHLLITERLLGLWKTAEEKAAADAYAVCIQLGAILAVFIISFPRIRKMVLGLFGKDPAGLRLAGNLVLAFLPAALMGLLLEARIKHYLFTIPAVAAAWLVGGIFILVFLRRPGSQSGLSLEELTWDKALIIGLAQCFALWPGVSRSLSTMGAGILLGLAVPAAVEFSFLLGLVTLGAATIFEGVDKGREIVSAFGWVNPLIGMAVAAVTAFIAVRWMVSYLSRRSPAVFGWYRLVVGAAAAALLAGRVI